MNATRTVSALGRDFQAIVGNDHVQDGSDLAIEGLRPGWVLRPGDESEISAVLRLCHANDLVVVPGTGLTKQAIGTPLERADVFLDMGRLNRVLRYDPGDLTIGVEAGARVSQVQSVVAAHNQLLPLDAPQSDRASIGGVLATSTQGPLKHGFGSPRDFCVGIRFVTADGTIAKAGGQVVKNVAGYDLMKLLIGSYGTLAVITQANFKLYPAPRQYRTFISSFGSLAEAAQFRDKVVRSPLAPVAFEIVSPMAEGYLSATLHGGRWHIALRASGSDAVLQRYRTELGCTVAAEIVGEEEHMLWHSLADFPANLGANAFVLDIGAPLGNLADVLGASENAAAKYGFLMAAAGRALGSFNIAFLPLNDEPELSAYAAILHEIRGVVGRDGAAVVTHCAPTLKANVDVWGESPTDMEAMRTVKRALDPRNILNRGRFLF